MRADIYLNLHKHVWSVRNCQTRRVAYHANHLILEQASFVASEAGRQRVLRERRKNVHAFVRGQARQGRITNLKNFRRAFYNPYQVDCFVDLETGQPLTGTYKVYMDASNKAVWYQEQK